MSDLTAAANVRAPHGYGTSHDRAVRKQAVTSASATAVAVGHSKNDLQVYVTFVCDVDCYIRFGGADVGAATTDDWPLTAGFEKSYRVKASDLYFSVIRKTSDGTLKWYFSEGTK